ITTTYEVAGASYAPLAFPFRSNTWSHGSACFSTYAFTRSSDWFTDTATPTNRTFDPYFACIDFMVGSSSRQLGHQVAQNSSSTGVLPTHADRSAGFPSSVSTAAPGPTEPSSRPMSCALRRGAPSDTIVNATA